jgi:hypothetical protein
MKLLVLSDSHGNTGMVLYAAEQTKPDAIIHLGDCRNDARELSRRIAGVELYTVKGNCDLHPAEETERLIQLGGVKLYITHGHLHRVKSGLAALTQAAVSKGADLALYGHTHIARVQQAQGITLMCPGQLERAPASYGIVTIKDGAFECGIFSLTQAI